MWVKIASIGLGWLDVVVTMISTDYELGFVRHL
jgi:hypothetical protein